MKHLMHSLFGLALVAVSTDFVFDGAKRTPYLEDDPPAPLSAVSAPRRAALRGSRGRRRASARARFSPSPGWGSWRSSPWR